MKFIYSERNGLDGFAWGQDMSKVRETLGVPYRTFPKTDCSENSTDAFGDAIVKVWYDASDCMSGLQINHPNALFFYEGKQLLGQSLKEAENFFVALGISYELEADKTGITVSQDSVRLYVPDMIDLGGDAIVKAIYINYEINA